MSTNSQRYSSTNLQLGKTFDQRANRTNSRKIKTAGYCFIGSLLATYIMPIHAPSRAVEPTFMAVRYFIPEGVSVQSYAKGYYMGYGATKRQWSCLVELWTRESNWNYLSRNRQGGAYGIPQAYPANKMLRFGSDWKTNPAVQIQWGLHYLQHRYHGDACLALHKNKTRGWY